MSGKYSVFSQTFNVNTSTRYDTTLNNPKNLNYDLLAARFDIKNLNITYSGQGTNAQYLYLVIDSVRCVCIVCGTGYPAVISLRRTCIFQSIFNNTNGDSSSQYCYQGPNILTSDKPINTSKSMMFTITGNYVISALSCSVTLTIFGINL